MGPGDLLCETFVTLATLGGCSWVTEEKLKKKEQVIGLFCNFFHLRIFHARTDLLRGGGTDRLLVRWKIFWRIILFNLLGHLHTRVQEQEKKNETDQSMTSGPLTHWRMTSTGGSRDFVFLASRPGCGLHLCPLLVQTSGPTFSSNREYWRLSQFSTSHPCSTLVHVTSHGYP